MFFQVIFCGINDFFRPLPRLPFQSGIRERIFVGKKFLKFHTAFKISVKKSILFQICKMFGGSYCFERSCGYFY